MTNTPSVEAGPAPLVGAEVRRPGAEPGRPDDDTPAPDDEVRLGLVPDERAPRQARQAVTQALQRWQLPTLVDAVVLTVSELVTNAVRHGRPPVELVLRHGRREVRLDVHDADAGAPGDRSPVPDEAESGRGMAIVAALADDVEVEQVPDDGKVVSVGFAVEPREHAGS